MILALTILAAIVALVVSAAPGASAGPSKAKAPRFERAERATAFVWLAELNPVKAAGFELSIDGHSVGFFAEMDSAVSLSSIVLKHGQGATELLSWAKGGTPKNATLELHDANGTPIGRYHVESAWVPKIEIGALKAGSNEILMESVTLVYAEMEWTSS